MMAVSRSFLGGLIDHLTSRLRGGPNQMQLVYTRRMRLFFSSTLFFPHDGIMSFWIALESGRMKL